MGSDAVRIIDALGAGALCFECIETATGVRSENILPAVRRIEKIVRVVTEEAACVRCARVLPVFRLG